MEKLWVPGRAALDALEAEPAEMGPLHLILNLSAWRVGT